MFSIGKATDRKYKPGTPEQAIQTCEDIIHSKRIEANKRDLRAMNAYSDDVNARSVEKDILSANEVVLWHELTEEERDEWREKVRIETVLEPTNAQNKS